MCDRFEACFDPVSLNNQIAINLDLDFSYRGKVNVGRKVSCLLVLVFVRTNKTLKNMSLLCRAWILRESVNLML